LFAESRQTMHIPLVTSIRRGLAGRDDNLRLAWVAAKPIYESGAPERALTRSILQNSYFVPKIPPNAILRKQRS
jgi:hypothetical protein